MYASRNVLDGCKIITTHLYMDVSVGVADYGLTKLLSVMLTNL